MTEPVWLPREVILGIQEALLQRFGGLSGIREESLLDSAIMRPQQRFNYEGSGIFELAASYSHGLVKNHPFLDGNKRIGFMAAYVFLGINGHRFNAPEEYVVLQTLALASGEISEKEYALWLADSCGELDRPLPHDP